MSRPRRNPVRTKAAWGVALLALVAGISACSDDGRTAPERCLDPALPIFDIQSAGAPADDNEQYPCVTPVGHAVSQIGSSSTGASTSGGGTTSMANAGAGGS